MYVQYELKYISGWNLNQARIDRQSDDFPLYFLYVGSALCDSIQHINIDTYLQISLFCDHGTHSNVKSSMS